MKALTLTQPWATLVAIGAKGVESRSWSTKYRGPLAIHAAKAMPRESIPGGVVRAMVAADLTWGDLPRGEIIAVCELVDVVPTQDSVVDGKRAPNRLRYVGLPVAGGWQTTPFGFYSMSTDEWPFGDYSPGRFAWLLTDVEPLRVPVQVKGRHRLWTWDEVA